MFWRWRCLLAVPALSLLVLFAGCARFGQVSQGRVIQYDAAGGLVTLIQDSNYRDPGNPRFDVLPPVTVRVPVNRAEMGPPPRAGKMLALDTARRQMVIFDARTQSLLTIAYTPVAEVHKVAMNDARVARGLPVVDRENRTITIYSGRQQALLTFSVAQEYFTLPADAWKMGDEVRYYYKEPGQALRMMNITRTDLTQGK